MLGEFFILKGSKKGFAKPEVVQGSDGKPLAIPVGEDNIIRAICTRPVAVDLDADGNLDIVAGNFEGTFWMFKGEGKGQFAPTPTQLVAGGEGMRVDAHSDPFFVDWDDDGDLDMISGSASGGVFAFINTGSKTKAKFSDQKQVLAPVVHEVGDHPILGDAHIVGPQRSTRVWAGDINGDGKLDLLIGDSGRVMHPAEGLSVAEAQEKLAEHDEQAKVAAKLEDKARDDAMRELWEKRDSFVQDVSTGFVWVAYGK